MNRKRRILQAFARCILLVAQAFGFQAGEARRRRDGCAFYSGCRLLFRCLSRLGAALSFVTRRVLRFTLLMIAAGDAGTDALS